MGIYRSSYGRAWLRIVIAATWPDDAGLLKTTIGVRNRRRALAEAGYRTRLCVEPHVLRQLRECPDATAMLAPIFCEVTRIAQLLGARPPRPHT